MAYWDNPSVRRGWGQISGGGMRTLVDSAAWLRQRQAGIEAAIAPAPSEVQRVWTGQVTALSLIAGCNYRWLYAATPVHLNVTTLAAAADPSIRYATAAAQVHAYNLYEWPTSGSTQDSILGDGTLPEHIPAGFAVVAVRGIVRITSLRGEDGVPLHVFDRANGIDGECP